MEKLLSIAKEVSIALIQREQTVSVIAVGPKIII